MRNRRVMQPPAHFQRNPLGRGQLAVFPRCSLLTYRSRYARRSRLEKQPTDLRRNPRDLGDGTLVSNAAGLSLSFRHENGDTPKRPITPTTTAATRVRILFDRVEQPIFRACWQR